MNPNYRTHNGWDLWFDNGDLFNNLNYWIKIILYVFIINIINR